MSRDKSRYRNFPRVDFSKANVDDHSLITFKLFNKENGDTHTVLTEDNIKDVDLGKGIKTVLFIHGWVSSEASPWYGLLKDAYLETNNYNIIYVDWSKYAYKPYEESSANVKPIGDFLARFLAKSDLPPKSIHLVGHSLGSHLAAYVGKAYQKEYGLKLGRITGLDPAGPSWSHQEMSNEERLCPHDADFVDVIHTDIQVYGITHPCGHVDFYPNGGTNQPGKPEINQKENHNHRLATVFFAESINNKVVASAIHIEEDQEFNVVVTHKSNEESAVFGEHVDQSVRGVFHISTNDTKPFLREKLPQNL